MLKQVATTRCAKAVLVGFAALAVERIVRRRQATGTSPSTAGFSPTELRATHRNGVPPRVRAFAPPPHVVVERRKRPRWAPAVR